MIFLQLKNTCRYAHFTRCDRKVCECMVYIIRQTTSEKTIPDTITENEHRAYLKCHKSNTDKRKDVFLL